MKFLKITSLHKADTSPWEMGNYLALSTSPPCTWSRIWRFCSSSPPFFWVKPTSGPPTVAGDWWRFPGWWFPSQNHQPEKATNCTTSPTANLAFGEHVFEGPSTLFLRCFKSLISSRFQVRFLTGDLNRNPTKGWNGLVEHLIKSTDAPHRFRAIHQ